MGQEISKKDPKYDNKVKTNKNNKIKNEEEGLGNMLLMMDQYPIKLSVQQAAHLYGIFNNKPLILTWADVVDRHSNITFRKCVDAKIDIQKLYNMQHDLQQWIRHGKVCLDDCLDLAPWKPNPFLDFQCHVGDLVVRKQVLTHAVLVRGGVTFQLLWERFGLTPAVMAMVRYTPEQWVELGMQVCHVEALGDEHWGTIFGQMSRKDVIESIKRHHHHH